MAKSLNLDEMTLRDKIREAARRSHDLHEHLEQAFVPKVHQLRKMARSEQNADSITVSDTSIRTQVATVLDGEKYTATLDAEASALFAAIADEVENMLTNGSKKKQR